MHTFTYQYYSIYIPHDAFAGLDDTHTPMIFMMFN